MRKGYMFTLAAFVLLLISFYLIVIRSDTLKNMEETYGTIVKAHSLEEHVYLLNKDNIRDFINTSVKYSLIALTFHVGDAPLKGNPSVTNFSQVLLKLMNNGTASGDYFIDNKPFSLPEKSLTLMELSKRINDRARKSGFNYTIELRSLNARLLDYRRLKVDYVIKVAVEDIQKKIGKNVSFSSSVVIDIEGMPDPIAERLLQGSRAHSPYYSKITFGTPPSSYNAIGGLQGNGWIYGRIGIYRTKDEPNVLVGTFNDVKDQRSNPKVDAIVIKENLQKVPACPHLDPAGNTYYNETNTFNDKRWREFFVCDRRDNTTNECLLGHWECEEAPSLYPYNKPWILAPGIATGKNELGQDTILIITNNYLYSKDDKENPPIFTADIEAWRDFINCGKALKTSQGPDYIQRFYQDAPDLKSPYGYIMFFIEDEYGNTGELSSVGFERLKGVPGRAIRGLAGCKSINDPNANCDLPTTVRISDNLLNNVPELVPLKVLAK